eukprot:CAMPEP_0198117566 /NCGR_PEP_ID=MMETSP1442-20131203/18584_1 /TAXON_ID= /ORGANISM="Craspedostauros australis, Strain CCMP3328" /LENGTH=297 /DNA_ID=CAMNT_0043775643 /DNA_START=548 /DNA_END=1441 /DNA_ORIENTATION=+
MTIQQPQSVDHAKQAFLDAVSQSVTMLTTDYGYSHDRAIASLLREISRSEATLPTTSEVFAMMKSKGYGIQQAKKILTVEKAMERLMKVHANPASAIKALTQRISFANLLNESYMGDETSSTSGSATVIMPNSTASSSASSSPATTAPSATQGTSSGQSHAGGAPKSNNPKQSHSQSQRKSKQFARIPSRSKLSSKTASGVRKRSTDETASNTSSSSSSTTTTRARADSVTQQIDAKVTATNLDRPTIDTASVTTTAIIRPKRSADSSTAAAASNTAKRLRTTSDQSRTSKAPVQRA